MGTCSCGELRVPQPPVRDGLPSELRMQGVAGSGRRVKRREAASPLAAPAARAAPPAHLAGRGRRQSCRSASACPRRAAGSQSRPCRHAGAAPGAAWTLRGGGTRGGRRQALTARHSAACKPPAARGAAAEITCHPQAVTSCPIPACTLLWERQAADSLVPFHLPEGGVPSTHPFGCCSRPRCGRPPAACRQR